MCSAFRQLLAVGLVLGALTAATRAQDNPPASPHGDAAREQAREAPRLPPDQTTHHTLELPGRTLRFAATAGAIRLGDTNAAQAEVAFVAYQVEGADRGSRPVAFVFNGGPGMASGWLQVGAFGPWRVPIDGPAGVPSTSPEPIPNPDTWLDFTDLVFIDPPGTGFSRVLAKSDEARRGLFSVSGDIDALADTIRRWLDHNDRIVSPKYLVGESYGGFRAPRLARALASDLGVGVSGIVLLSPLLDAHVESGFSDPFHWADRLASQVAAARAVKGPVSRADLVDVESYSLSGYLTDLARGVRDKEAVARVVDRVAALTGIDRAVVARAEGRLDDDVFLHELERARGRVGSIYDATVTSLDPNPRRPLSDYPDPVLEALKAPVTSAMVALYTEKLNWRPDSVYHLNNEDAFRQWNWGRGLGQPESMSALRSALSLDPRLRVLIAHGLFDLRTPYLTTARLLNQLPDVVAGDRVRLAVYPGGHMFYSEPASRVAFRDAAGALFRAP